MLNLKQRIEEEGFKQDEITTVSLDIKDMYPQCQFKVTQRWGKLYASVLPELKCEQINKCLDILCFSMGNTIVSFQDKYYEYGVDSVPDRHGLTIGGFELAFLAHLEATYIFDKLNMLLTRHIRFIGTYRDGEIIIFRGRRTTRWLTQWVWCTPGWGTK